MSPYFNQSQSSSRLPFKPTTPHNFSIHCQVDARISSVFLNQAEKIMSSEFVNAEKYGFKKAIGLIIIIGKTPLIDSENC